VGLPHFFLHINTLRGPDKGNKLMTSEFALRLNEIIERYGLPIDTVMEAVEAMMVSAYRRSAYASSAQTVEVKINSDTGEILVFAEKEVVEDVENPSTEVSIEEARKVEPDVELGGVVLVESTPKDFGRVAAQTAKQVILQRLREAEREAQYAEFIEREGDMVHGTVHSITPQAVTVGLLGRAEAILPRNQQIPGERFRVRDRIRVYVLEVRKSSRGPVIVTSRTHPAMLRRLLEMEVPEVNQGLVEIKAIAREAGKRAKVAVAALREGVDPVGACVGLRGVRIQSVVRDLNDEKIDVIEWNPDAATFIAKALSPARVSGVYLEEKPDNNNTAMVVVPEDQLSLAIGRAGVNARLAAKLTGWRIDIKSLPESALDSLNLLASDPSYSDMAEKEVEDIPQVEAVLVKKNENRPVTPEEYQLMRSFVNRVQLEVMARRDAKRQVEREKLEVIRAAIPITAYEVPLEDIGLSTRVQNLLVEAGYESSGQVMEQLEWDEDKILALSGVGPKAMQEMRDKLNAFEYPEPAPEVVVEEEVVEVVEPVEVEPVPEELEPVVAPVEAALEVQLAPVRVSAEEEVEIEAEPEIAEPAITMEEALVAIAEEFKMVGDVDESEEEIEEEDMKRRERKKTSRVIEFDPESGETVVKRRRKRETEDWEDVEY
jgi:N utilization substance protein A